MLASAVGLSGLAGAVGAEAATATSAAVSVTSVALPELGGDPSRILVDDPAGYIFFVGSGIVVTNLTGKYITTILDADDEVEGIALSPDGSTLYAALAGDNAVAVIDASTLATEATDSVGADYVPSDVAVQGGKLWVSYGTTWDSGAGVGGVGDFGLADLTTASPQFSAYALSGLYDPALELSADPSGDGALVVAEPDVDPPPLATYDVAPTATAPGTPVAESTFNTFPGCSYAAPVSVLPGGGSFLMPCSFPAQAHSTSTLAPVGPSFGTALASAHAAAVAPNGTVAVGEGINDGLGFGDNPLAHIATYGPAGGGPVNLYAFGTASMGTSVQSMAWSADSSTLYAVVGQESATSLNTWTNTLEIMHDADTPTSTLSLAGPTTSPYASPVKLSGTLTLGSGPVPAGTIVTIKRTHSGSTTTAGVARTSGSNGAYTFGDAAVLAPGSYTYTASVAGTAVIAASSATRTVTVTPAPTVVGLNVGSATVNAGATAHITAALPSSARAARTVTIYAWPVGEPKKVLKTAVVKPGGSVSVSYPMARDTSFGAIVPGNADYQAVTVKRSVGVWAKVGLTVGGYYRTELQKGVQYRIYHESAKLKASFTVAPNKHGECVKLEVQVNKNGTWYPNLITGCSYLGRASTGTGYLTLTKSFTGLDYRVRADYIRSAADSVNVNTDGGWSYFVPEP
jgi:YVTN family beta-propeller protein